MTLGLAQSAAQMRARWDAERYPKMVYVETTNHCNATCKFCLYDRMERPRHTMSMDVFKQVVAKVRERGIMIGAMFCFGEPLMDPGLFEKIRHGRACGVLPPYLGLNTNVSLLTPEKYQDILDTTANMTLSFVNTGARFEELTGLDWDRCYANAIAFIKYRDAHKPRFQIEIGCNDVKGHERDRVRKAFEGYRVKWARDAEIQWGSKVITGVIDRSIMYHKWSCDGHKGAMQVKPNGDCCFCAYDVIRDETVFANILVDPWEVIEKRFKELWLQPSSLCLRCDFWWNYHQMVDGGWKRGEHIDSSWQEAYDGTSIKRFWEIQHVACNTRFLTGSRLDRVARFLQIENHIGKGRKVLNIGVGNGRCTSELVKRGCHVSALDISEGAIARIAGLVQAAYTRPEALPDGAHDLVICHLVAQHTADVDLFRLMRNAIRSLTPEGVLAIQYASPPGDGRQYTEAIDAQGLGVVQRTPEHFTRVVRTAGGAVTHRVPTLTFDRKRATDDNQWNGVHVEKAE